MWTSLSLGRRNAFAQDSRWLWRGYELFFNWLNDQDLTELLSNDMFGANAHIGALFSNCSLFKNNEGHIAGLESQSGEKLHFDAPIEGKLEVVAHKVLVAM